MRNIAKMNKRRAYAYSEDKSTIAPMAFTINRNTTVLPSMSSSELKASKGCKIKSIELT